MQIYNNQNDHIIRMPLKDLDNILMGILAHWQIQAYTLSCKQCRQLYVEISLI